MSSGYLWVKAFHIVFVASWFAGLFYLPRIFVNLAMVPADTTGDPSAPPGIYATRPPRALIDALDRLFGGVA